MSHSVSFVIVWVKIDIGSIAYFFLNLSGCRHVLGFHQPATRNNTPSVIPLLWPRNPWWLSSHEWLRFTYFQACQCKGRGCLLQVPLQDGPRHQVRSFDNQLGCSDVYIACWFSISVFGGPYHKNVLCHKTCESLMMYFLYFSVLVHNCFWDLFMTSLPLLFFRCLSCKKADELGGSDPDYATRDLYNAISSGDYPSYTMYIQVLFYPQDF